MKRLLLLLSLAVCSSLLAADLTIPNTFTAGTAAVAGEVNANFAAVESAVDDNNARIGANEADIAQLNSAASGADESAFPCVMISFPIIGIDCFFELGTAAVTVQQVTISAPTDGFVLLSFSGSLRIDHTNGTLSQVCYELSTAEAGPQPSCNPGPIMLLSPWGSTFRRELLPAGLPSGVYDQTVHTQGLFPVDAGDTTFYLRADSNLSVGASVMPNSLIAQFVANRY